MSEIALLSSLLPEDRAEVLAKTRLRRHAKADTICREGDPGDSLQFVISGRLAVRVTTEAGDVATVSILSPGDAFGELALLNASHERTATVQALEPAEVRSLTRKDFEALCVEHPGVHRLLSTMLADRVDALSKALLEALYVGVDRRIIRRLVDLADVYAGSSVDVVVLPITQEDLAGMAGTTRPTANQVLQKLASTGALTLARGRIEINDVAALRRRTGR